MRLSSIVCCVCLRILHTVVVFVLASLIQHRFFRSKCSYVCACVCVKLLVYVCKMTNSPLLSTVCFITITDTVPSSLLLIFTGILDFQPRVRFLHFEWETKVCARMSYLYTLCVYVAKN